MNYTTVRRDKINWQVGLCRDGENPECGFWNLADLQHLWECSQEKLIKVLACRPLAKQSIEESGIQRDLFTVWCKACFSMSQTCLQLETDFLRRKVIKCSLLTKATKAVLYHALLYMYYRQAPWQNQLINNLERFRTPKPHKRLAFKASVECWQAIHFTDYIIIEFLFFSES